MRKLVMVSIVAFGMGFLALANADNTPPPPPTAAPPRITLPPLGKAMVGKPRIVSVTIPVNRVVASAITAKLATPPPVPTYEIEVENPSSVALDGKITITDHVNHLIGEASIDVPARSSAKINPKVEPFINNGCRPMTMFLQLRGSDEKKKVTTTPTCTFSSTPIDPEASLTAQQKTDARKGKISYESATLTSSQITCGAPFAVKAVLKSQIATPVTAGLVFDGPGTSKASAATETFSAAGSKVQIPTFAAFPGYDGDYILKIDRTTEAAPVYQPGWGTKVSRSCTYTAVME